MKRLSTSAIMLISFLAGCAHQPANVICTNQNWKELGMTSATRGESPRTFDVYRNGCGDKLEKGAVDLFLDGYTLGVVAYCTYDNGYALGNSNKPLTNICPTELRTAFIKGHKVGRLEINERLTKLKRNGEEMDNMSKTGEVSSGPPKAGE